MVYKVKLGLDSGWLAFIGVGQPQIAWASLE
jgi:hypothetical protein